MLAGGVGGARLAHGLQVHLGDRLTVVVNTADDLERHGLLVCPDHDTVMYTLAGIDNRDWGWGIAGETFAAADQMAGYGEESWFRLGDRDLAAHIVRTNRLRGGMRLTEVLLGLQAALGIPARILAMADEPVRTEVRTDDGWLDFQTYFVRLHQEPEVRELRYRGLDAAQITPEVLDAFRSADAIVIAPSNPFLSIAPILGVRGMREALDAARTRGARIIAMSGIVGGKAIKGPADRILTSLGHEATAVGVAGQYRDLIDAFVIDTVDADLEPQIRALGPDVLVTDSIMSDDAARSRVASFVLDAIPPHRAGRHP